MFRRLIPAFYGLCVALVTLHAAVAAPQKATVLAVDVGGTLQLAGLGSAHLADVVFPDVALAEGWLASHVLQQEITFTADGEDRYGRMRIRGDVQARMLRDGVALWFSNAAPLPGWRSAEAAARMAKRGVWASPTLVLPPEKAAQHMGEFHVVEGVITRIYVGRTATYVNFGADWHSDFSVTIPAKFRRSFETLALKAGDRVAVRGVIYSENGPMLRVTHPEQVERR